MNFKEHKKKLLEDPEFRKEYERFDLWFEIEQKILEWRSIIKKIISKLRK